MKLLALLLTPLLATACCGLIWTGGGQSGGGYPGDPPFAAYSFDDNAAPNDDATTSAVADNFSYGAGGSPGHGANDGFGGTLGVSTSSTGAFTWGAGCTNCAMTASDSADFDLTTTANALSLSFHIKSSDNECGVQFANMATKSNEYSVGEYPIGGNKVAGNAYTPAIGSPGTYIDPATDVCGDGLWHHIALVFDGSPADPSKCLTLYLDAVQADQDCTFSGTLADTTGDLTIAANSALFYFIGTLDNLRIYDYAQSVSQIEFDSTASVTDSD